MLSLVTLIAYKSWCWANLPVDMSVLALLMAIKENAVVFGGVCFVKFPINSIRICVSLILIGWSISALMLEDKKTKKNSLVVCLPGARTHCIHCTSSAVNAFISQRSTSSVPKQCRSTYPDYPGFPQSSIFHPLRGAWEYGVEITEPIKTLPRSIESLCITWSTRERKCAGER